MPNRLLSKLRLSKSRQNLDINAAKKKTTTTTTTTTTAAGSNAAAVATNTITADGSLSTRSNVGANFLKKSNSTPQPNTANFSSAPRRNSSGIAVEQKSVKDDDGFHNHELHLSSHQLSRTSSQKTPSHSSISVSSSLEEPTKSEKSGNTCVHSNLTWANYYEASSSNSTLPGNSVCPICSKVGSEVSTTIEPFLVTSKVRWYGYY